MLTLLLLTGPPVLALLLSLTDPVRHRPAGRRRGRHAAARRPQGAPARYH